MNPAGLASRVFAYLLALYPAAFRAEFAEEMQAVFTESLAGLAGAGLPHMVAVCLREYFDIIRNLPGQYLAQWKKESGVEAFFYRKAHDHPAKWGGLVFGAIFGLQSLLGTATGLSMVPFAEYTWQTYLLGALINLLFVGAATRIFWLSTPRRGEKWRFLAPVLAIVVMNPLLNRMTSEIYTALHFDSINSLDSAQIAALQAVSIGWPLLRMLMWGLAFGACFGWAYRGRAGILPFAGLCALGRLLGAIVSQVFTVLANVAVYQSTGSLPETYLSTPLYYLWGVFLVAAGGMIFGALLGLATARANRKAESNALGA